MILKCLLISAYLFTIPCVLLQVRTSDCYPAASLFEKHGVEHHRDELRSWPIVDRKNESLKLVVFRILNSAAETIAALTHLPIQVATNYLERVTNFTNKTLNLSGKLIRLPPALTSRIITRLTTNRTNSTTEQ